MMDEHQVAFILMDYDNLIAELDSQGLICDEDYKSLKKAQKIIELSLLKVNPNGC